MAQSPQVYLDHAAGAPLLPEVLEVMQPYLLLAGNPSSVHAHGRRLRVAIEQSRRKIASILGVSSAEIFFTSGGTEANNWALRGGIKGLGIRMVISSALEHASVAEVLDELSASGVVKLKRIAHDARGCLNTAALSSSIDRSDRPLLISLMHSNNEVGNLLDTSFFARHKAEDLYFHSDMVQSIGHLSVNLGEEPLDMASVSAHKFHGPKGIGLLYVKQGCSIAPLQRGGRQERNLRAGTEQTAAIVGMAHALELSIKHLEHQTTHLRRLKTTLVHALRDRVPEVRFNGTSNDPDNSLPTLVSVSLPQIMSQESLLMRLDVEGISVSVGSACASGSTSPSSVLQALDPSSTRISVRISFSKLNTEAEILRCVDVLAQLMQKHNN